MHITECTNQELWDTFLSNQKYRPFMQSWTMGKVYEDTGQKPIRLAIYENEKIIGICQAIIVNAKRGRHLTISYGPIICEKEREKIKKEKEELENELIDKLKDVAKEKGCCFIRISPFVPINQSFNINGKTSPMHLLAEHIWYLPLIKKDPWQECENIEEVSEESIFKNMRQNHRNLIRRAQREGVEIIKSNNPMEDINHFHKLHAETRKRHGFTPYSKQFFEAQIRNFAPRNECTLYLAKYNGEIIATSIHMHAYGETSYHHGASTAAYPKIPASYLLQWTAILDALNRGDHIYNFWGIAPEGVKNHPFCGVTLFKKGFGGMLFELQHCSDIPLSSSYHLTRLFEFARKWKRGF